MSLQLLLPLRSYLNLGRTRAILGCFLAAVAFFVVFSRADIRFSSLFFDHGFYMANQGWTKLLHVSVTWFIVGSLAVVIGVYVFNKLARRSFGGISGKKVIYLLLVAALGAGLIVNGIFKDGFGRARPRDIVEFGGSEQFTPVFYMSSECDTNCSFSSGDSAGAFFALAFAIALTRKRSLMTAAVGFGVLVSAARIAAGAHFLSDTIVSFFVMLIVADALHYRMFLFKPDPVVVEAPAPAPVPAALIVAAEKPSAPL